MGNIDFTEEEIRAVWKRLFNADAPETLSTKEIFDACLSELSPEGLREEIRCIRR